MNSPTRFPHPIELLMAEAGSLARIHQVPTEAVLVHSLALASAIAGHLVTFRSSGNKDETRAIFPLVLITPDSSVPDWIGNQWQDLQKRGDALDTSERLFRSPAAIPDPRFVGKSAMGARGDSIVQADWEVGEVLRVLDELRLADYTQVIFTSDNGPVIDDGYKDSAEELLENHHPAGPFRGGKYSAFEGGTRMPTFARWPAAIKAGKKSDLMISQVDFPRSLSKIAGKEVASGIFPDSLDVSDVLLGRETLARDHVIEQPYSHGPALRLRDWKYIEPAKPEGKPMLFDLAKNSGEKSDVAAKYPEKLNELKARMKVLAGR